MFIRLLRAVSLAMIGLALSAQVRVTLSPRSTVLLQGDKLAFTARVQHAPHTGVRRADVILTCVTPDGHSMQDVVRIRVH